jgi:hypothetical protein
MRNGRIGHAAAVCLWIACAGAISAQNDARGHWTGNVNSPAGVVAVEVDLDKSASGWIGSLSIPAMGASGIPLDPITFADGKVSFSMKGPAGSPGFSGTLAADGKTMDGNLSMGPQSLPLKLNRTGEAKVEVPKPSPPVTAEFLGTWEGTVNFGAPLRLTLTISNGTAGAEAVIVSLDQGNANIPVTTITQKGTKLSLEVKAVGGGYEGEMNKEGTQINGMWSQLGQSTPLLLKKAGAGK